MKFCKNCGQQLDDSATFCSKCGSPTGEPAGQPGPAQYNQYAQPGQPVQPVVMDEAYDVQSNRGIAWLAYCGLLLLVPMFARKNSEYCKFHVKQGATLLAATLAYAIVAEIIKAIFKAVFAIKVWGVTVGYSTAYYVIAWIFGLGYAFFSVMAIIGIINAATGKKNKLPVISMIPWIEPLMDKIYASMK